MKMIALIASRVLAVPGALAADQTTPASARINCRVLRLRPGREALAHRRRPQEMRPGTNTWSLLQNDLQQAINRRV